MRQRSFQATRNQSEDPEAGAQRQADIKQDPVFRDPGGRCWGSIQTGQEGSSKLRGRRGWLQV